MAANAHALVTGASSGIGRAIAVRLAQSGPLILHGRDRRRLEETRAACSEPARHKLWVQDFADPAASADSLRTLLAADGARVDTVVHCAGLARLLRARDAKVEAVNESLNVNYVSAQQVIAALLEKRTNGDALRNIVLVSSIFSTAGAAGHSLYCASKAALNGMMRALAVELAPRVRVNCILPGAVDTPMAGAALEDPAIRQRLQTDYPLGIGQPQDVAAMVEFLVSENARWITGQEIVVDGGRSVNFSLK